MRSNGWSIACTRKGSGSQAGDYVTTGVTTDIYDAQPGDHLTADFGPVGAVELQF